MISFAWGQRLARRLGVGRRHVDRDELDVDLPRLSTLVEPVGYGPGRTPVDLHQQSARAGDVDQPGIPAVHPTGAHRSQDRSPTWPFRGGFRRSLTRSRSRARRPRPAPRWWSMPHDWCSAYIHTRRPALTERSPWRTANAISRLARGVIRARGGTDGVDYVNHFRLQEVLVHNHFRLCHTILGMSGSILMSRGRVVTHPFGRYGRTPHPGGTPTQSMAVRTWMVRVRSTSTCTDSTTTPSSPSSNEPLVWRILAPLLLDA